MKGSSRLVPRPEQNTDDLTSTGSSYVFRDPVSVLAPVSVLLALIAIALTMTEIRRNAQGSAALGIVFSEDRSSDTPVLAVGATSWKINNQPVTDSDVVFRLSGLASGMRGILVEYGPAVSSDRLTQALDYANRAGFSNIGLRVSDERTTEAF